MSALPRIPARRGGKRTGSFAVTRRVLFPAPKLADAATPRLWYLAPQSELAGVLKTAGR